MAVRVCKVDLYCLTLAGLRGCFDKWIGKSELKGRNIQQKPDPKASWAFKTMNVFEEKGRQYGLQHHLSLTDQSVAWDLRA